jgi:hypothetical protein
MFSIPVACVLWLTIKFMNIFFHKITLNYWVFGLYPLFHIKKKLENTTVWKLDLILMWGGQDTYSDGSLRKEPQYLDNSKVEVNVTVRPTVSRPVCPCVRPPSGPVTNFSFSLKFSLVSCRFVIVWWEEGSVIYCCCWASSAQSLSGLSPVGLKTIFYCPNFFDFLCLEGQVRVFTSPSNRVAQENPNQALTRGANRTHSLLYVMIVANNVWNI